MTTPEMTLDEEVVNEVADKLIDALTGLEFSKEELEAALDKVGVWTTYVMFTEKH